LVDTIAQVNVTLMQKQKEFIKTIADLRSKLQLKVETFPCR
jgi:hypothetical protein